MRDERGIARPWSHLWTRSRSASVAGLTARKRAQRSLRVAQPRKAAVTRSLRANSVRGGRAGLTTARRLPHARSRRPAHRHGPPSARVETTGKTRPGPPFPKTSIEAPPRPPPSPGRSAVRRRSGRPKRRVGAPSGEQRWETTMPLQINDTAPDFTAETTQGRIRFHDWLGDGWCVLVSHPKDFTPVCTTELRGTGPRQPQVDARARLKPEFDRRGCKIVGVSVDPVEDHVRWSRDIEETQGQAPNFPMIGDHDLAVAKLYGMLPAGAGETSAGRTAADNATVRNVFVIGPDKKVKLVLVYPMSTGRNFAEILRA